MRPLTAGPAVDLDLLLVHIIAPSDRAAKACHLLKETPGEPEKSGTQARCVFIIVLFIIDSQQKSTLL